MKYNAFVPFLSVLSCPLFSGTRPGRTVGPIFTLCGSNDVFSRKEVPFGIRTTDDVTSFVENMPQNPVKVGVNRQFHAKMPKYKIVLSPEL